jgi:hypothetical protein
MSSRKPGNPEAVKRKYEGPPVSARNRWYHINGITNWLEKRGTKSHKCHDVCTEFLRDTRVINGTENWNRTAIKVQDRWEEFVKWFDNKYPQ